MNFADLYVQDFALTFAAKSSPEAMQALQRLRAHVARYSAALEQISRRQVHGSMQEEIDQMRRLALDALKEDDHG